MTTCKDAIDLLLAYVEGELPAAERERLEAHFSDCQPCEDFLAGYKKTPVLCRSALARTMPSEVASRLTGFLKNEIGKACACGEPKDKPKG